MTTLRDWIDEEQKQIKEPTLAERNFYTMQLFTIVDMTGNEITYLRAIELINELKKTR